MPVINPEKLAQLQQHAKNIRNICVLAHVDHGKTSLTDGLLATNGIISPKLAGKIRYLDSRPDEQLRGITMESSAISLLFSMMRRPSPGAAPALQEYLINLIDSPGHIDFSSEVSTASRLCDGAVVLVDAVEGVCSQTVTVLRQTWVEKLKPLLVINKIDRLVTELRMTPDEAYVHLSKLLEQVNAVLGSFFQGERMEDDLNWRERIDERMAAAKDKEGDEDTTTTTTTTTYEEKDDEDIYFAPEKNNVIFSSAIDGWAFTVRQFAVLYERKLGVKSQNLEKVLWGNYYLDPKTKKVLEPKHLKGRHLKPMFVQLVLEPVWAVYKATLGDEHGHSDPVALQKITSRLDITIPPHIQRSHDQRLLLTTVFAAWLPLSTAVLVSVVESLPSPAVAQADRMDSLLDRSPDPEHIDPAIRDAMVHFDPSPSKPVVVYVSKMVSMPESELPENKRKAHGKGGMTGEEARELARQKRAEIARAQQQAAAAAAASNGGSDEMYLSASLAATSLDDNGLDSKDDTPPPEKEHLIGFARIYSGPLSVGDSIWVLPPKFAPAHPNARPRPQRITVTALYMLMGRNLEALDSVPAGVVFGLRGLEANSGILKSATLCSQVVGACNLAGIASTHGRPIVRVSLEPSDPNDLERMIAGLKLLVQSDPCAEYEHAASGEHVLLTAGELHLERCLTDLRERFAHCDIQPGAPIVPYRETLVRAEEMRPPVNKELGRGVVEAETASKQVTVTLSTRPLPAEVTSFLIKHSRSIRQMEKDEDEKDEDEEDDSEDEKDSDDDDDDAKSLDEGIQGEETLLEPAEFQKQLHALLDRAGPAWRGLAQQQHIVGYGPRRCGPNILASRLSADHPFADRISYAFQLAVAQGPLCHEPVQGLLVVVDAIHIDPDAQKDQSAFARLTGELLKTVQHAIHKGFLDWSPRLMLAMYSCEIQASTEVLGRVYDVLTRRRGRVLSETMKEGTPFFTIVAMLPVAESFGFADEMRKRTSGAAQPQLIFAGFEVLEEDPFWVPFTEEALEDLGTVGDRENVAKRYMDAVRRRKGLLVEGRNVARDAEKQKTLKR